MTTSSPQSNFSLECDAWGKLVLKMADGRRFEGVEPVRAFPISGPDGLVSICDAEGHEILCIEALASLPSDLRAILETELARSEFVPIVTRIEKVNADAVPSVWHVDTDRGASTFLLEDTDNDVRRLSSNRLMLVDTHGIRYLIPNIQSLDASSRKIIERFV